MANRKFLQLLNVRYVLVENELNGEGLKPVYDGEIKIYEDMKAFPRAWIVPEAKILKRKEDIFEEMRNPGFNPGKTVILEEEVRNQSTEHRVQSTESKLRTTYHSPLTRIVEYHPEKVTIEANLSQEGFLVLSDSWYPGWKAFVDGVETEVLKANYIMRAVKLVPGRHQIEFLYDNPPSFKLGIIISLSTLLLIFILIGGALFKHRL